MSKKILSLALVVVMLMSMFAFTTSAVDLSAGQVAVKIVSDAVIGAPAGTVVTVKAYYVLPAGEEDAQFAIGNISLGYNNAAYSVEEYAWEAGTFAWGETYADYFKQQKTNCNASSNISNNIVKKFSANDTAKGWNAALQVMQTYEGATYTKNTGYPVDVDCEIFSLQFVALKEITANDVIGVVEGAYGQNFFKVNLFDEAATTKYATYDAANVYMSEGVATPASPVYKVGNAQYRPNGANYDLGVKFGFKTANIGIEFNEKGTSTNIASVGATLKVNGTPVAEPVESRFVYDVNGDNSEYQFRVVIEGVAADSTDKYEIATFVKYTDGTVRYADVVTINAADVIPG